jgi:iron complex outermembrane receptor protein
LVNTNATVARACLLGTALELCTITTDARTTAPTTSNASTAATGDSLAEVVVTAQRRTENAQTVPIALSVISGDTLEQTFGVNNVDTLQEAVPGLNISMDTGRHRQFGGHLRRRRLHSGAGIFVHEPREHRSSRD